MIPFRKTASTPSDAMPSCQPVSRCLRKGLAAILAGACLGAGAGAQAAMVSAYATQANFNAANPGTSLGTESFTGYSGLGGVSSGGFTNGFTGSVGGVSWAGNSSSGMFAQSGAMSTNVSGTTMIFTFAGTGLRSVAGSFYATNIDFAFLADTLNVTVKLSDNNAQSFSKQVLTTGGLFWGFQSSGAAISELRISPSGGTGYYATLDDLQFYSFLGSGNPVSDKVPEPNVMALLLGGLLLMGVWRRFAAARRPD